MYRWDDAITLTYFLRICVRVTAVMFWLSLFRVIYTLSVQGFLCCSGSLSKESRIGE